MGSQGRGGGGESCVKLRVAVIPCHAFLFFWQHGVSQWWDCWQSHCYILSCMSLLLHYEYLQFSPSNETLWKFIYCVTGDKKSRLHKNLENTCETMDIVKYKIKKNCSQSAYPKAAVFLGVRHLYPSALFFLSVQWIYVHSSHSVLIHISPQCFK